MQLSFDIPEKELAEYGKETIQQEIEKMLRWLKIKRAFKKISAALKDTDQVVYFNELETIRESTWNEYKKDLEL